MKGRQGRQNLESRPRRRTAPAPPIPRPARPPRRPPGRPPAPPKPRQAREAAIRSTEPRPRDNWVMRIFEFVVRLASFALELETLGRCAWRTSLACHLLLRLDARVRVTVGGAEPEARPGRYRARAHDREPAG